jgi:hypothetical protein
MAANLSALSAGSPLHPRSIFWYSFLLEAEYLEGSDKLKKKNTLYSFVNEMSPKITLFLVITFYPGENAIWCRCSYPCGNLIS